MAQNEVIATHKRCDERDQMILVLDHYLDALLKKPRAVRDARAMYSADIPDVVRNFHREIRHRRGTDGDKAFVRFMIPHREVGMEAIVHVLKVASAAQVYHLEGLHELVLQHTGQVPATSVLSADKLPIDLTQYRVQKADTSRYNVLTVGGEQ